MFDALDHLREVDATVDVTKVFFKGFLYFATTHSSDNLAPTNSTQYLTIDS